MNNAHTIEVLRKHMRENKLSYATHCALSWCIAKLLKEDQVGNSTRN